VQPILNMFGSRRWRGCCRPRSASPPARWPFDADHKWWCGSLSFSASSAPSAMLSLGRQDGVDLRKVLQEICRQPAWRRPAGNCRDRTPAPRCRVSRLAPACSRAVARGWSARLAVPSRITILPLPPRLEGLGSEGGIARLAIADVVVVGTDIGDEAAGQGDWKRARRGFWPR